MHLNWPVTSLVNQLVKNQKQVLGGCNISEERTLDLRSLASVFTWILLRGIARNFLRGTKEGV